MQEIVLFAIVGLGTGAMYAALSVSLVVIYKGTAMVNLAQGAMSVYGAYVVDEVRKQGVFVLPIGSLTVGRGMATAIVCGIVSAVLLAAVVHLAVFRPLRSAPPLAKVVASVGLLIAVQALVVLRFSSESRVAAPVLPIDTITWGSIRFSADRLYLPGMAIALATLLWAYFRFTTFGVATRAASENETAAAISGYSPNRLALSTWILSAVTCGLMAILVAPSAGLSSARFTLYIVPALAVALLARFGSIWVACFAGLALGALQSEMVYLTSRAWWPQWAAVGLADVVPLVLIVATLFVAGDKLPGRGHLRTDPLPAVTPVSNRPGVVLGSILVGVVALVATSGAYRFGVITSMIAAIIALSLVVLTGIVGQVSLAQAAIAGAAGFTLSKLSSDLHIPFPLDLLGSATVAGLIGVVVGLPALRIRGAQLAVVTLAGAVATEQLLFRNPFFAAESGNPIRSPSLFGIDLGVRSGSELTRLQFGLLVLVVLALVMVAVGNLSRSATGRTLVAVRSNERAAAGSGVNVAGAKLVAFGMSSFVAGIGGCLLGYSRGQLSADSFGVFAGMSMLAVAYLGGITGPSGALIAALFAPLGFTYVLLDRSLHLGKYYQLASGVALVASAIANPVGIAGQARRTRLERSARRQLRTAAVTASAGGTTTS